MAMDFSTIQKASDNEIINDRKYKEELKKESE